LSYKERDEDEQRRRIRPARLPIALSMANPNPRTMKLLMDAGVDVKMVKEERMANHFLEYSP